MSEEKIPIPYQSLIGHPIVEPVLSKEISNTIAEALIPITHERRWKKFGMDRTGRKGTKILLIGPPGCGKTTIAIWMAKKVSQAIIQMTMADIGSSDPGGSERHIKELFKFAKKKGNATIFMEECDAFLWSRELAGQDSMFMIGVINQLLIQIESFEGLVVLATNFHQRLDPALMRRLSYVVEVEKPDLATRILLWEQKIPCDYPFYPKESQIADLAKFELTGSEIESVIDRTTRRALREGHNPTYEELYMMAHSTKKPLIKIK